MSASWNGSVRLADADALPGHYYVTVVSRGKTALALGPFTQPSLGKSAHARALGYVQKVRHYVRDNDRSPYEPWYEYGTARLPITASAPAGKLNGALLPVNG